MKRLQYTYQGTDNERVTLTCDIDDTIAEGIIVNLGAIRDRNIDVTTGRINSISSWVIGAKALPVRTETLEGKDVVGSRER